VACSPKSRFNRQVLNAREHCRLEIDDIDTVPSVNWVVTDAYGMLLEASAEAAEMLNLGTTGLRWRQLLVFFDGDREHSRQALCAAAAGLVVDREGAVRPRKDVRSTSGRGSRRLTIRSITTRSSGLSLSWTGVAPAVRTLCPRPPP
jgi:hypothetical protein